MLEPILFDFYALSSLLFGPLVVVLEPFGISMPVYILVRFRLFQLVMIADDQTSDAAILHALARDELLLKEPVHGPGFLEVLILLPSLLLFFALILVYLQLAELRQEVLVVKPLLLYALETPVTTTRRLAYGALSLAFSLGCRRTGVYRAVRLHWHRVEGLIWRWQRRGHQVRRALVAGTMRHFGFQTPDKRLTQSAMCQYILLSKLIL